MQIQDVKYLLTVSVIASRAFVTNQIESVNFFRTKHSICMVKPGSRTDTVIMAGKKQVNISIA